MKRGLYDHSNDARIRSSLHLYIASVTCGSPSQRVRYDVRSARVLSRGCRLGGIGGRTAFWNQRAMKDGSKTVLPDQRPILYVWDDDEYRPARADEIMSARQAAETKALEVQSKRLRRCWLLLQLYDELPRPRPDYDAGRERDRFKRLLYDAIYEPLEYLPVGKFGAQRRTFEERIEQQRQAIRTRMVRSDETTT